VCSSDLWADAHLMRPQAVNGLGLGNAVGGQMGIGPGHSCVAVELGVVTLYIMRNQLHVSGGSFAER
jgi:hypothetical protein